MLVSLEERFRGCREVRRNIHLPAVWKGTMHLEKRLPQEAVATLEKTAAAAVTSEGKVESVGFRLCSVCVPLCRAFQEAGCRLACNKI
jgi:hypothetical protein